MTSPQSPPPSGWIRRFSALVLPGEPVLDLACGSGRHARWFAARGHPVVAVDHDAQALAALRGQPSIEVVDADLERGDWPFAGRRFGGIVVTCYLHRPLFPLLLAALAADAAFLYETFAVGNERVGRPTNPAFLLEENELLDRCLPQLRLVGFEQGQVADADRIAVLQRIAAVGRERRWPPRLPAPGAAPVGPGGIG
jgi:SAM-dependent methyltransferase